MIVDINLFFNKMINQLNLGDIIEEPLRVTGGLTHRMFKLVTSKGRYIVKLLNPNIMKRPTAMGNFNRADNFEEIKQEFYKLMGDYGLMDEDIEYSFDNIPEEDDLDE